MLKTALNYMSITKISRCADCGKEFKPYYPKATKCYECYKRSKRSKRHVEPRFKEIDTSLNKIQSVDRPLTDEEKSNVAYMLGRFTTIPDIQKYYLEKGKEINYESIKSIRDSVKWKPIVDKYRQEWLERISEVPIANKRVRLEAWQTMLEKGFASNKMTFVKNALQGAREEIEGIHQQIGGNSYSLTYIANMSDNELLKKRDELMSKIKHITSQIEKDEEPIELEAKEVVNAERNGNETDA